VRRSALLLVVALASCNESLFDANVGGDAGPGGGGGDAAPGGDAGPGERVCPEGCQGDPVEDFDVVQGGKNGRWLYSADNGGPTGVDHAPLESGTYEGVEAWVGPGGGPPAIVPCPVGGTSEICSGVEGSLLLVPSPAAGADPVLEFVPPANGTYRLAGSFRIPAGAEGGLAQRLLFSRNSRNDLLLRENFATSTTAGSFSFDVEALAGDAILLTLLPNSADAPVPVAFDFFVTLVAAGDAAFPGACQFAATFDDPDPLVDRCSTATLLNLNNGAGGESVDVPSVNERHGRARELAMGQFLRSTGSSMDYSGDFTVQFWLKLVEPQPFSTATAIADWNCVPNGGLSTFFNHGESAFSEVCYMWKEGSVADCADAPGNCINFNRPKDGDWHFYRISRESGGMLRVCVDGVLVASDGSPGAFDMSSDEAPHIGRNVTYNPAYTDGAIDDVRIFKRALPCAVGP
jgi:hypothetical protein